MIVKSAFDIESLITKIVREGALVNGTYELNSQTISTVLMDTKTIREIFGISKDFEDEFKDAINNFKYKHLGPYDTEKYLFLLPKLKEAVTYLASDCLESRRCTIVFPQEHCFQSIQFLLRENTIHVVCFMRSCNALKNLTHDLWICSLLADYFAFYTSEMFDIHPYKQHKITMTIGSLHTFLEDL